MLEYTTATVTATVELELTDPLLTKSLDIPSLFHVPQLICQ